MLTKLTVWNFQSHKKRIIDLDPKITTIIGPTDAGKSAVVRILKWICTNKPAGVSFIRDGAKQARGDLVVDGHTISRRRSKKGNIYRLDGHIYKAFGNDVPNDITKLLNLSSLNFQGQHDKVFWFSSTAGQVGKELNSIVNLDIIDRVTANVTKKVRESKTKVKLVAERLAEAKKEKQSLKWIVEANRKYQALEKAREAAEAASCRVADLSSLLSRVIEARQTEKNARSAYQRLRRVLLLGESHAAIAAQSEALSSLIEHIEQADKLASVKIPDTTKLDRLNRKLTKTTADIEFLDNLLTEIQTQENEECRTEERLARATERLRRRTKGKCPVCGRKLA